MVFYQTPLGDKPIVVYVIQYGQFRIIDPVCEINIYSLVYSIPMTLKSFDMWDPKLYNKENIYSEMTRCKAEIHYSINIHENHSLAVSAFV